MQMARTSTFNFWRKAVQERKKSFSGFHGTAEAFTHRALELVVLILRAMYTPINFGPIMNLEMSEDESSAKFGQIPMNLFFRNYETGKILFTAGAVRAVFSMPAAGLSGYGPTLSRVIPGHRTPPVISPTKKSAFRN